MKDIPKGSYPQYRLLIGKNRFLRFDRHSLGALFRSIQDIADEMSISELVKETACAPSHYKLIVQVFDEEIMAWRGTSLDGIVFEILERQRVAEKYRKSLEELGGHKNPRVGRDVDYHGDSNFYGDEGPSDNHVEGGL